MISRLHSAQQCYQRLLGLEPPQEMKTKMGLKENEIVQLLKGAYGRADALLLWFQELKKGLLSLNFDGLYCGTPEFHD